MRRLLKVILTFCFLVGAWSGAKQLYNQHVLRIEASRPTVQIQKQKEGPSAVLFYKDSCPDCQKIFHQVVVAKELHGLPIQMINLNQPANRHYIAQYNLKFVPTFLLFKNGKPVERVVSTDKAKISSLFRMLETD